MRKLSVLSAAMTACLAVGGCTDKVDSAAPPERADANAMIQVATVNGRPISQAAFDAYLQLKRIDTSDNRRRDHELDAYLEREALSDAMLQQDLLPATTVEAEVAEFRKQMIISRYFEAYLNDKVSEQAVRNFYTANLERFQSRKVHVAHILLRTNPGMGEIERQALLNRAQEVHSRLLAQEDFAQLAATYSDDVMSAKKGGDLGWIQEGAIDAAFSRVAFSLDKGGVSEPLATPFGFHVLKVIDAPQVIRQPYEKVKGDIRFELRQQAKKAEMERLQGLVKVVRTVAPKDAG